MKFSFVSAVTALAIVAALAGCGGKAKYTVQGSISNLNNSGLVLTNGGEDLAVASGATSFAFKNQIDYGTMYNITVKTQPDHMTCSWYNATNYGSAGYNVSISATLTCVQNSYSLSGQYTGITGTYTDSTGATAQRYVRIINGSSYVDVTSTTDGDGKGDFVFSTAVYDGQSYGVTVQPGDSGITCTVTNGTGVMHEAAVTNLQVDCEVKAATTSEQ